MLRLLGECNENLIMSRLWFKCAHSNMCVMYILKCHDFVLSTTIWWESFEGENFRGLVRVTISRRKLSQNAKT